MSRVCIDCAGKHEDFRGESGHLELDPETGATVLVPHTEPEDEGLLGRIGSYFGHDLD